MGTIQNNIHLLQQIIDEIRYKNIKFGDLQTKTITQNGTYIADNGYLGLDKVIVEIPTADTDSIIDNLIVNRNFTSFVDNRITTIGPAAFAMCSQLNNIDIPNCSYIGSSAFYGCSKLTSVSFPVCSYIGNGAFYNCTSLTSVSFPVCSYIGGFAFNRCISLTSASFPVCSYVGTYAFYQCYTLTSVNFPVCSSIGNLAFGWCSSLTSVSFPVCAYIGNSAFYSCSSLTSADFGGNSAISKCSIYASAFVACKTLTNLTLRYSFVATLSNANTFTSTPMSISTLTGSFGSIYVPASLVNSYKSATNWAVYASRITAIVDE